jgi:hypothetical protein
VTAARETRDTDLGVATTDQLYAAMDWLAARQDQVEKWLTELWVRPARWAARAC